MPTLDHVGPQFTIDGSLHLRVENHALNTASGGTLDLDDPTASQIVLEDIAGALSRVCRFSAQAIRFHSVAQHAMLVSRIVAVGGNPDWAFAALHHDSHEAYVCDLPSPLKRKLERAGETTYRQICDALDLAIMEAFGIDSLSEEARACVKAADREALMIEAGALLPDGGARIGESLGLPIQPPNRLGKSVDPKSACDRFLHAHRRLSPEKGALGPGLSQQTSVGHLNTWSLEVESRRRSG